MPSSTNHLLVRRTHWDDTRAVLNVWWELYHYAPNWYGKMKWLPKTETFDTEFGTFKETYTGDREWADRIAEHYNISVPEGENAKLG